MSPPTLPAGSSPSTVGSPPVKQMHLGGVCGSGATPWTALRDSYGVRVLTTHPLPLALARWQRRGGRARPGPCARVVAGVRTVRLPGLAAEAADGGADVEGLTGRLRWRRGFLPTSRSTGRWAS